MSDLTVRLDVDPEALVGTLSPAERTGVAVARAFSRDQQSPPRLLVLDEPTNHLDLESINALNIALQKYDGTVLLVTHDYDVIDEVATRLWHFKGGKIEDFKGPYSDYLAQFPQSQEKRPQQAVRGR